ncbi:hypothetical protein WOLCODRAFT_140338 [Wolfiporia cocos MD-104 SS10]|uniref:Uncharacterized protein n=1 Tax=Wolfiporia cocos (strain MD-104) TaxID=742152 RepID=A0A2H3JF54_WOLCO|nr:hypothetical protein WOLCODRAFT_140338 [Wolfiporia cocos MD-104 SS10]
MPLSDGDARRGPWSVPYTLQTAALGPIRRNRSRLYGNSPPGTCLHLRRLPRTRSLADRRSAARHTPPHVCLPRSSSERAWHPARAAPPLSLTPDSPRSLCHSRLRADDATYPYVAIYAPPAPASATHARWTGLLYPTFVADVATALICVPPSILILATHG